MLGHPRDAIHPFSDAKMLAEELPNGRLIEANSLYELRLRPRRLTNEIAAFLDECWTPAPRRPAPPRARPPSAPRRLPRPRLGRAPAPRASASRAARSPDWSAPSM